ncbi:hypothetical protein SAMN05660484_01225 [Eubacterium ruminantium]|uniref:DUF4129 domain-containing protein n=4 Tax=Eubacterium ruminantium TaxID=42322 RepID=A0A1T4MH91_9FIRM|nr:hypothetical protein SAMN05660484_01225 [Eubacterium ruminantium]SDM56576.1 hypothetical protein SAMN04490370_10498 [Eubacterium ruminantium]SJZ66312.1 hypothetical protein SAMN02745110_01225 [Eubacterium ruminantium]
MTPRLKLIRTFFVYIYNTIFIYFILDFLLFFFKQKPFDVTSILVLCTISLISYLLRYKANNNILILFLHILMFIAVIIMPDLIPHKVMLCFGVVYYGVTAMLFLEKGKTIKSFEDLPLAPFAFGIFVYIYGFATHNNLVLARAYTIPLMLFLLHFIILYMDGVREFFDTSKDISKKTANKMLNSNTIIVAGVIFGIVLMIFLANVFGLDEYLERFLKSMKWILFIFVFFFRGIGFLFGLIFSEEPPSRRKVVEEEEMEELIEGSGNSFYFLVQILVFTVIAIMVFIILRRIIKLILARKKEDGDIVEKLEDVRGKEAAKNGGVFGKFRERFSNEEKFRRLYRKNVIKLNKKNTPSDTDTTFDIRDKIREDVKKDITKSTDIYNEVRYGEKEVDNDTLKRLKKSFGDGTEVE